MSWKQILKNSITYEWLIEFDDRPILLADLGNEKVLFYKRTGSGGEPREGEPAGGMFAPFFGFSYWNVRAYWFIKGEPNRYDKYKKEAEWLDKNVKETPSLSDMRLDDANNLFKSKGAILGRPKADTMGYKPVFNYSDFKFMSVVGEKLNFRKAFEEVELDYKFYKRKNQEPKLTESYEELKEYNDSIELSKLKYNGDALQPQKKEWLKSWINKEDAIRKEISNKFNIFKKLWEDWDIPEINLKPLEYKELTLREYNSEKNIYGSW